MSLPLDRNPRGNPVLGVTQEVVGKSVWVDFKGAASSEGAGEIAY
ncbi:hypothetical protein AB0D47_02110 [Streptomyces sp. NPDC048376]